VCSWRPAAALGSALVAGCDGRSSWPWPRSRRSGQVLAWTYPLGPVRISVPAPSARRIWLIRTSMFPRASAGVHPATVPRRSGPSGPARQPAAERTQRDLPAVAVHHEPAEQPDPDHCGAGWRPAAGGAHRGRAGRRGTAAGGEPATGECWPVMTVTAGSPARPGGMRRFSGRCRFASAPPPSSCRGAASPVSAMTLP
jgi:hypothetical protein